MNKGQAVRAHALLLDDGFDGAYWRRPSEMLRESVWRNTSTLNLVPPEERAEGLKRLESEVRDGTWNRKYGNLLGLNEFDLGYLLLVWRKRTGGLETFSQPL